MPQSFTERYRSGDSVAVWNDLISLGDGVRHELYYQDARAVAQETMKRCRHNVEMLIRKEGKLQPEPFRADKT